MTVFDLSFWRINAEFKRGGVHPIAYKGWGYGLVAINAVIRRLWLFYDLLLSFMQGLSDRELERFV